MNLQVSFINLWTAEKNINIKLTSQHNKFCINIDQVKQKVNNVVL